MTHPFKDKAETLVIFDCDGVLVDSEIISCRVMAKSLTSAGYTISTEEVIRLFVGMSRKSVRKVVEQEMGHSLPEHYDDHLTDSLINALSEELQSMHGINSILESLPNRCLASSGLPEKINTSLKTTRLDQFFAPDQIFSATMVKNGKPAPDLFLLAAETMGFSPADCIVIEDSVPGIQAAIAAEMTVFGFSGGSHILDKLHHKEILEQEGAVTVLENWNLT